MPSWSRLLPALLLALAFAPVAPARAACDLPLPSGADTPALPHVAAALRPPSPRLDMLVLGSATVLGPHGATTGGLPAATVDALRAAMPGLVVSITVQGARGQTATDMLARMHHDLSTGRYHLVLWQTGTVEAVRRLPPPGFAATIAQGAAAVHAAGADLVMIDPQFSQMLESRADLPPYRAAVLAVLDTPGNAVLDRYGLMQGWARSGALDLDRTPRPHRAEVVARLQACLGEMLARRIIAGARAAAN